MTCPPHHWILDNTGLGRCRKCKEKRQFNTTLPGAVDLKPYRRPPWMGKTKLTPGERQRFHRYLEDSGDGQETPG